MKLKIAKFGNPILRQVARRLSVAEITSPEIQQLIAAMKAENQKRSYGVGVAAPQFGVSLAICIIGIKPTPTRPGLEAEDRVMINPEITETFGHRTGMWEGCWSFGDHTNDSPYAKAMRFKKIMIKYYDESGRQHHEAMEGFLAHVAQHETDHLNGVLFVDKVKDPRTYIMASEYKKLRRSGQITSTD